MAAAPARFLQHFRPPQRNPFETLRVNHPRGELGEESFVELDGVTYLIVSTGNGYYDKDAPFSLFNLETGQEIKSRFADPVIGLDMFGKEKEFEFELRKHTSVSCGNKLAVHFQSGQGTTNSYFEVVYELRGNKLHELERTPMHTIDYEKDIHRALFMDVNTIIYANIEGVFIKVIGSGTEPNRICSAPHIRPYGLQSENPICMLGANILLKNYITGPPSDNEEEDEEPSNYELYILRPPFTENLSMISERCSVSTVYENQLVFVRKDNDDDDDDDDDDDGALHYKWHVMKYTAGSTTGPAKLYSLPPQTIQHYNLEYDGRYIGHHVVTYGGYDYDDRMIIMDTEQVTFMDEYDEDIESYFASYDKGFHLFNWGLVVFKGEEMEFFMHDKSMGFDDPVWQLRKDKNASVFYEYGLNDHEDHCISPNKQYLLLHVAPTSSSKGYRYVMDLQVFYDVSTLLNAYSQHIKPLILAGRGLEAFNTGPGQKAIDFVIRDQMPEIPDLVKRMRDYSEQRKECLKFAPLPPSLSLAKLGIPLWELFANVLQMDSQTPGTSAASAAGNASKKSRRLFGRTLKF